MKPAPLVALGLALNRGKSPYFVLISGRYTSRGRPDHLTTSEHSDRGCGEADSAADTGHRTEGPQRPGNGRRVAGSRRRCRARDLEDASIRTNPEARARIQAFVERRGALRRLAPQLLRGVPL